MTSVSSTANARALSGARAVALPVILASLFLFSGAAGLIYQVLWVRLLSLTFGITVYAVTVVLASFMGGLAIGSYLGGRYAERLRRPLLAYGLIEIAIGAAALITPALFAALQRLYPTIASLVTDQEAALLPVRVFFSFLVLVVPTSLMGATLPIIVKSSLARNSQLTNRIGLLYTANTAGAIAGTLLAGFWLIGDLGITRSIQIAAATNLGVGLLALGFQWLRWQPAAEVSESQPTARIRPFPRTVRLMALIAYGLSGACSFAYEVVWTRMLSLVLDTSIYAFVTMLAMVLVGIAAGSAIVSPLVRRNWRWPLLFALVEVLIAVGSLWAIWAISHLGDLHAFLETTRGLRRLTASTTAFNFVVAAVTILPSTLLIGATFPIAARIYTAGVPAPSRSLGEIYAVNVFGAIFGSILGGFLLLPLFGTQTSLLLIALVSVGIAVALALTADAPRLPARIALAGGAVAVFGGLWLIKPDLYEILFRARFPNNEILYFREGLESTVTVARAPDGVRTLYTNSRGQANDEPSLVAYHRRIAHIPLLVHPGVRDVLIVGLGGGGTAGSILQHPGTRVEAVELSDAVRGGAALFPQENYNVLQHPNFSLRLGDGRNYLLTTTRRYDLITSDTIQPYDAGSTNLYSADYYRLALQALKPGGIVAQWVGPFDDFQYKVMIRTFLSVFPDVTLWLGADLLIGSREPITIDMVQVARRFESPEARAAMRDAGLEGPEALSQWFVATRSELEAFVGEGPIWTDDQPIVEYYRSLPTRGHGAPPDLYSHFSRDIKKILVNQR